MVNSEWSHVDEHMKEHLGRNHLTKHYQLEILMNHISFPGVDGGLPLMLEMVVEHHGDQLQGNRV